MKICPYCKEEREDNARVCPACGETLNIPKKVICPHCKEEIEENSKVCPVCGEALKKQSNIKITLSPKLRTWLIGIIGFILLLLLIWIGVFIVQFCNLSTRAKFANAYLDKGMAKQAQNKSLNNIAETINEQEQMTKNYMKGVHLQSNKNFTFYFHYENLLDSEDVVAYKIGNRHDLNIISSKMPYIKIYNSENYGYIANIDYDYLNKTYSQYLDKTWKDYLSLENKIHSVTDTQDGWYDNDENPTIAEVFDWILSLENFMKKHPKFNQNERIKKDVKTYVDTVFRRTCDPYLTYDGMVTIKKEYSNFLNKADKKTKSYKYIKEAYDILESHNNDISALSDFLYENDFGGWGS